MTHHSNIERVSFMRSYILLETLFKIATKERSRKNAKQIRYATQENVHLDSILCRWKNISAQQYITTFL